MSMSTFTRTTLPGVPDLSPDVLDSRGNLRVMPAEYYAKTSVTARYLLGANYGYYGLPTTELVLWLRELIGTRSAIEVGAGAGTLSAALGIVGTDNCMQQNPILREHYETRLKQAVVPYGRNVLRMDAAEAVRELKPQVVLACWLTHKFDPARPEAEGNMFGVVEEDLIANCETYVMIGNAHVHRNKSIWRLPHTRVEPPWLYSRAHNGSKDFIAVWGKNQAIPPI